VSGVPLKSRLGNAWRSTRARARGCAIVLTYHRVGDAGPDPHKLNVSRENFEEQIAVISRDHSVLTATQLAELIRAADRLPQRAVVVTFDDGYAETHAIAAPILAAHGVSATSFLCSDWIGSDSEYPWDRPAGERTDTVRPATRILTPDEARSLDSGGVIEFGAHTRTHPVLSSLDSDGQRDEVAGSKTALEELLGRPVSVFAYPHGGPGQFDERSASVVGDAGFAAAFTTIPGIVWPHSDRFAVPRFHTENISGTAFQTLLNGWFDAAR